MRSVMEGAFMGARNSVGVSYTGWRATWMCLVITRLWGCVSCPRKATGSIFLLYSIAALAPCAPVCSLLLSEAFRLETSQPHEEIAIFNPMTLMARSLAKVPFESLNTMRCPSRLRLG